MRPASNNRVKQTLITTMSQALLDAVSKTDRDDREALLEGFLSLSKADRGAVLKQYEGALASVPGSISEWEKKHALERLSADVVHDRGDDYYTEYRYSNGLALQVYESRIQVCFYSAGDYFLANQVVPYHFREVPTSLEDLDRMLQEAVKYWRSQCQWHSGLIAAYQAAISSLCPPK